MYTRRRRGYFLLMSGCLILFVSAWSFVRLWSVPAAIGMCVVAMVIPPVAAIVANTRAQDDRWWDEPPPPPPPGRGPGEDDQDSDGRLTGHNSGRHHRPGAGRVP